MRAIEAAAAGWQTGTIRVWVQLRWRNKLTIRAASKAGVDTCPVCQAPSANSADHLFSVCPLLAVAFSCLPVSPGEELLLQLRLPRSADDAVQALRAASCVRANMWQVEPADDSQRLEAHMSADESGDNDSEAG